MYHLQTVSFNHLIVYYSAYYAVTNKWHTGTDVWYFISNRCVIFYNVHIKCDHFRAHYNSFAVSTYCRLESWLWLGRFPHNLGPVVKVCTHTDAKPFLRWCDTHPVSTEECSVTLTGAQHFQRISSVLLKHCSSPVHDWHRPLKTRVGFSKWSVHLRRIKIDHLY